MIRNGKHRNGDGRIGELVVTKRKSVRLDDIARVLLVLWNSQTSAKKWSLSDRGRTKYNARMKLLRYCFSNAWKTPFSR